MAGFEDAYKRYTESGQGQAVANMYDQQTQASMNGLKAAYDQNLASQQAAREQIGTSYQNAANNMQAQYERNRRNLNQQAAANGINTGAGSQQQLALQNVWNRDYGTLQGQQAQAYTNADLAIAKLQTEYQNAIQQAQAQGDYRKMAALLDDYNNEYNRQLQNAKVLASYGDFSGYNGIYSPDQITNMRNTWISSNPQLAYNLGLISAEEYARMTGQSASGSSSGGGSRSWSSTSTPATTTPAAATTSKAAASGINPLALNAESIIEAARQSGASAVDIARTVDEAVNKGLISAADASRVVTQANQAAAPARDINNSAANYLAAGASWSPSLGQQTGMTEAEWRYAQQMLNGNRGRASSQAASNASVGNNSNQSSAYYQANYVNRGPGGSSVRTKETK